MFFVVQEWKIGWVEWWVDCNFIRQKFDKVMVQYEMVIRCEKDEVGQVVFYFKIVCLYFMVREYGCVLEYYDKVMSLCLDLFGVDDVCDYVDVLCFQG